jgi:DNA-binding transcriptional LysR family regulator
MIAGKIGWSKDLQRVVPREKRVFRAPLCDKLTIMTRRIPPLNAIRAFEAAGRLGRMTDAADELAVTHGAVSRQVRQLEEHLGLELFEGPRNRPVLSDAGRALLPALTAALNQIEAAVRAVQAPHRHTLDVSCLSSFTMRWLIPRLYRFNALDFGTEIRLIATDQHVDVRQAGFDVVISVRSEEDPEPRRTDELIVVDLFKEKIGPVLSPSLASRRKLVSPGDLLNEDLLRTATRPNAWALWQTRSKTESLSPKGAEFQHYYYTLEAASAGLGICLTPEHLVTSDIEDGRLVAPFGFIESGYTYFAARRAIRHKRAAQFCAWLEQEIGSPAAIQNGKPQPRTLND